MKNKEEKILKGVIAVLVISLIIFLSYKAYGYISNKPKDISNVDIGDINIDEEDSNEDDYMSFVDSLTTPPCLSTPLYNTKENLALYYTPDLNKHSKDGDIYELISNKRYGYETVYNSSKYELVNIDNNDSGALYLKPKENKNQRGSIYIDVIEEASVVPKDIYKSNINKWKEKATLVNKTGKFYDVFSVENLSNDDLKIHYTDDDIKYVMIGNSYYEVDKDIKNNAAKSTKKLHYIETPLYDIKISGSVEDSIAKKTAIKQYFTLMMDKVFVFTVVSPEQNDNSYEQEVIYMIDNLTYYNQLKDVEMEQNVVFESELMKYKVPQSYRMAGKNNYGQGTFERDGKSKAGLSAIIEHSFEVAENNEYALKFLENDEYKKEIMLMSGMLTGERLSDIKLNEYTLTESVRHGKKDVKVEFLIKGDKGMLPLHGIGYGIYDKEGILHTITVLTESNNDFIANREIDNIINSLSLKK